VNTRAGAVFLLALMAAGATPAAERARDLGIPFNGTPARSRKAMSVAAPA
jgi:hypothetical protein